MKAPMRTKRIGIHPYQGCDGSWVAVPVAALLHKFFNRAKRRRRR